MIFGKRSKKEDKVEVRFNTAMGLIKDLDMRIRKLEDSANIVYVRGDSIESIEKAIKEIQKRREY